MAAALAAQQAGIPPVPALGSGPPPSSQNPQATIRWTIEIPAAPVHAPLIAGGIVFVTFLPGIVAAHDLSDPRELWHADVNPDFPVAADNERVYIAGGEALHALGARTGAVAWRTPTGTLTAPPLVKDGWVIVSPAGRIVALRATDGTTVWSRENAMQRSRPTIEGDTLIVPLANGHVQALDLETGTTKWDTPLGGVPGEALVLGERVYVGTSDKRFYCLKLANGRFDWHPIRVGAVVRGRPASDGVRVYFVALDNAVRAVDRVTGAQRWHAGYPFRPFGDTWTAGGSLLVAGPVADVHVVNTVTGKDTGKISFPETLAAPPAVGDAAGAVVVAGVTGGLAESWKLTLASYGSAPASVPDAKR